LFYYFLRIHLAFRGASESFLAFMWGEEEIPQSGWGDKRTEFEQNAKSEGWGR
jgi:hypothetical protein